MQVIYVVKKKKMLYCLKWNVLFLQTCASSCVTIHFRALVILFQWMPGWASLTSCLLAVLQCRLAQAPWVCRLDLEMLQPSASPRVSVEPSSNHSPARPPSLSLLHIPSNPTVCVHVQAMCTETLILSLFVHLFLSNGKCAQTSLMLL